MKVKTISLPISALLSVSVLAACSSNTAKNQTVSPSSNATGGAADNASDSTGTGGTAETQNKYADGVYEGTGTGKEAGIKLDVTIKDDMITDIVVIKYYDTPDYFDEAAAQIIPAIIDTQSTDLDMVSGCTYSSKGIIQAVNDALSQAEAKK
jgi:uncharacterized protein with FMN-binding domain